MSISSRHFVAVLVAIAPLALGVGCGKKGSTVSGLVTYDGEPVPSGFISFAPEDGQGKTAGAPIRQGKYKAMDVPPGRKRIQVVSGDANAGASRDSGEEPTKIGPDSVAKPREDLIPQDAKGNNVVRDISQKNQVENFDIEKPAVRRDQGAGSGAQPGLLPGMPPQQGSGIPGVPSGKGKGRPGGQNPN